MQKNKTIQPNDLFQLAVIKLTIYFILRTKVNSKTTTKLIQYNFRNCRDVTKFSEKLKK
jgi:hypothetical protein